MLLIFREMLKLWKTDKEKHFRTREWKKCFLKMFDEPKLEKSWRHHHRPLRFLLKSIFSTFYEKLLCRYFFAKKLQSLTATRKKLHKILCWWNWHLESILSTFSKDNFLRKIVLRIFMSIQFGFVIFWP